MGARDARLVALERKTSWGTLSSARLNLEELNKLQADYTLAGRLPADKKLKNRLEILRSKLMRSGVTENGPVVVPKTEPFVQPIQRR